MKKTKKDQRKLISPLEPFQQVQFVNFYIYMTCRLQKLRKPLQGSFLYICVFQSEGKTVTILQQISHWSSKIKSFQNQIGRLQTIPKRTLTKFWTLDINEFLDTSNLVNTKVAKFIKYQAHGGGVKSLTTRGKY